jgi:hypothetical protein
MSGKHGNEINRRGLFLATRHQAGVLSFCLREKKKEKIEPLILHDLKALIISLY